MYLFSIDWSIDTFSRLGSSQREVHLEMPRKDGWPRTMRYHSDFDRPWCQMILSDPNVEWQKQTHELQAKEDGRPTTNTMFQRTLYTDSGIIGHLSFRRACSEPEAIFPWEECFLISVGDGIDGAQGRAHGGFNSLLLDHICGHCAAHTLDNDNAPATATLTTDYKAPVSTPCVILCRGWVIEHSGRKVWVKAVIEDESGKVLAAGKALFIASKKPKL